MPVALGRSADAARRPPHPSRPRGGAADGQALVETALVLPLLLLLAFGVVGVARVSHAQMAVGAVAREAARAGALANTWTDAVDAGTLRGREVALGYNLDVGRLALDVDPGAFERAGRVRAVARYAITLCDLPLLSWTRVELSAQHAERLDPYRSRAGGGGR